MWEQETYHGPDTDATKGQRRPEEKEAIARAVSQLPYVTEERRGRPHWLYAPLIEVLRLISTRVDPAPRSDTT